MTALAKTGLVAAILAFVTIFGVGGVALYWEMHSYGSGGTFSELFWTVWANQPWVVFLVSHILACPFWFLMGHFVAQSKATYEQIRNKSE